MRPRPCSSMRAPSELPVVVPQLVVEPALFRRQLAVEGLLDFGRQLRGDLLLGAAQDEGAQGAGQQLPGLGGRIAQLLGARVQGGGGSQDPGVQELEQAPQLAQMVLHRRAAQRQAIPAAQQAGGLGRLAVRVLDRLRLVQDDVVEFHLPERRHVLAQGAVGGEHQIPAGEGIAVSRPADAGVIEHAQPRREMSRLGDPVEHQRARHHHQGRRELLFFQTAVARGPAGFEQGEHLHGLAEPHVVRQAAAEAEVAQEVEPSQAGVLIGAELALEARRRFHRLDSREGTEPLAGGLEGLIAGDGLFREPGVEEGRLDGAEPQVVPFRFAEPGHRREFADPLLGKKAEAAIAQRDEFLAAAQGREQGRQPDGLPLEVRLAAELEPVDARGHGQLEPAGGAVELPLRLDGPPFGEERGHGLGDAAGGDPQRRLPWRRVLVGFEAQVQQTVGAPSLRFKIPQKESPLLPLVEAAARRACQHRASLIGKGELGARPGIVPVRLQQAQARPGGRVYLLETHRFRQLEAGEVGRGEKVLEQVVPFRGGHPHSLLRAQQRRPAKGTAVREA